MIKKLLFLIPGLYLLVLIQQSFLSHLSFFGAQLNLVLILVFLLNVFGKSYSFNNSLAFPPKIDLGAVNFGLFAGFFAGLMLDIFSSDVFGIFTLNLLIVSFLIKKIAEYFEKSTIFASFILFFIYFFCYKIFLFFEKTIIDMFLKKEFICWFCNNIKVFVLEFFLSVVLILLILGSRKLFINRKLAV